MQASRTTSYEMEGFTLGRPALVCRWRLAGCALPLENRHLRALSWRQVAGKQVAPELVAWAKQHIEWTLGDGARDFPDGVLMLIVDEGGQAAMAVGGYEPLAPTSLSALAQRAQQAEQEFEETGIAPETLWLAREGSLVAGVQSALHVSGSAGLVMQLAETLGIPLVREDDLAASVIDGTAAPFDEAFLVSDEHGVVPARGHVGHFGRRLVASYNTLLERERNQRRR